MQMPAGCHQRKLFFRVAERLQLRHDAGCEPNAADPPSKFIRAIQVPSGFDVADNYIVNQLEAGDLVITADIPLASGVIEKGGHALNPRGDVHHRQYSRTLDHAKFYGRAAWCRCMSKTGGLPPLTKADRQALQSTRPFSSAKRTKEIGSIHQRGILRRLSFYRNIC